MLRLIFLISFSLYSAVATATDEKVAKIEISRPVLRLFNKAQALQTSDLPKLYNHRCYLQWSPEKLGIHRIFCVNELDPIITLEFVLRNVTFRGFGRNGDLFRMEQSDFAKTLFTVMQNQVGSPDIYVSSMQHCGQYQRVCDKSYSVDLSEKAPHGSLTCTHKKMFYECVLSAK